MKFLKDMRDKAAVKLERMMSIATPAGNVVTVSGTKPLSEQMTKENCRYVIKDDFDLGGTELKLPAGTVLEFKGGSITNGVVRGDASAVIATRKVFSGTLLTGSWTCAANVGWWAEGTPITQTDSGVCFVPKRVDRSADIQYALSSQIREIVFPPVAYYVARTLILRSEKRLTFQGTAMKQGIEGCNSTIRNTSILFTDQDITLLQIAVREGLADNQNTVAIHGGNFDTTLCAAYTHNVIEVRSDNNERVWGLTINTTILGRNGNKTGCGIYLNPVKNKESTGYITQVRIGSTIQNFGIGIKAVNYMEEKTWKYYNWCTDVQIRSNIICCPLAVDTNTDTAIDGMIQAGFFWSEKENNSPIIRVAGDRASVGANIFDLRLQSGGLFANYYALDIVRSGSVVAACGIFAAFITAGHNAGMELVTGHKDCLI